MLNLTNIHRLDDVLLYESSRMYWITQDDTGYAVTVEDLDEDGEAYTVETYAASSLSTAIAIIERLEAGEAE